MHSGDCLLVPGTGVQAPRYGLGVLTTAGTPSYGHLQRRTEGGGWDQRRTREGGCAEHGAQARPQPFTYI